MSTKHHTKDWWVSPFNFVPEVRAQLTDLPDSIRFHDVTLRDGEQTPGVVFRKEEKVRIAGMLDEVGVDRIEVALPAVSAEDVEAVKAVVAMRPRAEVFVLSRVTESDIDLAAECGVDGIIMEMPAGAPRLQYQFKNWTEDTVIERTLHALEYARGKGLKIVLFPMDITRAEPEFFYRFMETVASKGPKPDSIALVDTTGSTLPQAAYFMIKQIREITGCVAEIHTHNDFELGVATPLAAVAAGAEVVHCSIGGLGERTGNTALESVATALRALYGMEMNIDFSKLTHLARETMDIARHTMAISKPMVGERTFTRESGMGLDLIREEPLALFALNPAFLGQKGDYVLGKKSGMLSVDLKLADLGMKPVPEDQKKEIVTRIKNLGIEKKGLLTDEEFVAIVRNVAG
jgi:isopropylmalate/homocitrate/citramalate synthase